MSTNVSKSATRALNLLTYFAQTQEPMRALAIAAALDLPRSSADQLLKTLVGAGYLVFDPDRKTYFPSPRLSDFGGWIAGTYAGREELTRILYDLHDATGELVTLTMQNDCFMQVTDCLAASEAQARPTIGVQVPIVGSAVGGAVLTTKPFSELRRVVTRARRMRATGAGPTDLGGVSDLLLSYRHAGYAWSRRRGSGGAGAESREDMVSLAVPLPQRLSRISMALGLAAPARRVLNREREIAAAMRRCILRHLPDASFAGGLA
jgi:DNA-binding IclR family transcriptional regulator